MEIEIQTLFLTWPERKTGFHVISTISTILLSFSSWQIDTPIDVQLVNVAIIGYEIFLF